MSTHKDRFAARLRRLRRERGYSAARHFAQALGIPENRYTRYERGDSEPDLDDLYLFFEHLPASPNELFGVEGGPPLSGQPPGFASGPQEPLDISFDDAASSTQSAAIEQHRRSDADAAAWALATTVIRHKRPDAITRQDHMTLAELRETGLLFKRLRSNPYETLFDLVTKTDIEQPTGAATSEIEQAIAHYTRSLG